MSKIVKDPTTKCTKNTNELIRTMLTDNEIDLHIVEFMNVSGTDVLILNNQRHTIQIFFYLYSHIVTMTAFSNSSSSDFY